MKMYASLRLMPKNKQIQYYEDYLRMSQCVYGIYTGIYILMNYTRFQLIALYEVNFMSNLKSLQLILPRASYGPQVCPVAPPWPGNH